jgi:hypothetical protein
MGMTRRRCVLAVAATLGLIPCGMPAADPTPGPDELATWVEQRVRQWQPTREERRFDDIGWARDIRAAERLAREHGRPVFLFTYDGDSLAQYRC